MRERGNGSKQSISCLDKALSVAEAWHTVFSLTDTSQRCACTTHTRTNTHTHKQKERKLFRSKFTLPAPTCFVVCCDCFHVHTHTHHHTQLHPPPTPRDKSHRGKMPPLHYTYHFLIVTVTQVNPALVVDLNGLTCVTRHGFVTLLLTRVEHRSDTAQL